jgi:hypothetical protein
MKSIFEMNNSNILWLSSFYQKATYNGLFDLEYGSQGGICPYILEDKDCPLLPLLMIPHKQNVNVIHYIFKMFYNKYFSWGKM